MNMKFLTAAIALSTLALSAVNAATGTDSQSALLAEAKVTQAQATATAMAKVPGGVIKSSELETEGGRLVWSFDIAKPSTKGVTEILVDARTGQIVSMKRETPAEEAREAKADARLRK